MSAANPSTEAADGRPGGQSFASVCRRLAFAGNSYRFFDRLFSRGLLQRVAVIGGDWPTGRLLAHQMRVGFDLFESLRSLRRVPNIGNVELSLLGMGRPVPQHPNYRSYWYDPIRHSTVGMLIGIDLIRHEGKYYLIELNHGPSIYARRRELYGQPFDPMLSRILETARELGFRKVVLVAFRWRPPYPEEAARAAREYGIDITLWNSPIEHPEGIECRVCLPDPLEEGTMVVIHSGPMGAVTRFLDNKWYSARWLGQALEHELPPETLLAMPATSETLFLPAEERGVRWPNLVVKLAGGARSLDVLAARFENEAAARETLGMTGRAQVPRQLRAGFAKNLLIFGRDRVLYQEFIPPELDARGHAQMIRLHLLVSPLRTTFLSAHFRLSRGPIPPQVPEGIIRRDNAFVFNDADYRLLPPEIDADVRSVAEDLGGAIQRAITRTFQTGPAT
jgi:hypothetical protein